MAALRLTSANLEFLKRQLGLDYPEIGSAHRTEALAVACGYRTYASQLAELRADSATSPIIKVDGQRWSARLAELGYQSVPDDRLTASIHAPQIPDPCWVEFPSRDRTVARRWFYRCKADNLPYVTIEMARKYATLEWDCITLDSDIDRQIRDDESGAIVKELSTTFRRCSAGSGAKPYFFGSAFVGSIKGVRPDVARTLADEFFTVLYQASRLSSALAAA